MALRWWGTILKDWLARIGWLKRSTMPRRQTVDTFETRDQRLNGMGCDCGMSDMSAQDLELASTDDLIKELLGRFDAAVFTGTKYMSEHQGSSEVFWKGDFLPRLGLADFAKQVMFKEYQLVEEEDDTDGES
jgi:hypothetical protein